MSEPPKEWYEALLDDGRGRPFFWIYRIFIVVVVPAIIAMGISLPTVFILSLLGFPFGWPTTLLGYSIALLLTVPVLGVRRKR